MIKVLVGDIEQGFSDALFNHTLLYLGVIVIYQILNFLVVRKGYLHHGVAKVLNKKYMTEFVQIDNTYTEKYGTGRLISIIEGGIAIWADLLHVFFMTFPEFVISFIYASIIIGNISLLYLLVFFALLFGVWFFTLYLNKKAHILRKDRYELQTVYKRNFIKILM